MAAKGMAGVRHRRKMKLSIRSRRIFQAGDKEGSR